MMHEPTHKFQLGDEVRDVVSPLKGIVVAYHHWFTGCDSASVSPQMLYEGKPVDPTNIDVTRLVLVRAGKAAPTAETATTKPTERKGGPHPNIQSPHQI